MRKGSEDLKEKELDEVNLEEKKNKEDKDSGELARITLANRST